MLYHKNKLTKDKYTISIDKSKRLSQLEKRSILWNTLNVSDFTRQINQTFSFVAESSLQSFAGFDGISWTPIKRVLIEASSSMRGSMESIRCDISQLEIVVEFLFKRI